MQSNEDQYFKNQGIKVPANFTTKNAIENQKTVKEKSSHYERKENSSADGRSKLGGRVYYSAWKDTFKSKTSDKIKLTQINEEMSRPYEHKSGNFVQLFPFSKATENLSIDAYRTQSIKNPTKPNYTKLMITQINK